jgi:glutamate mutase epsilon subunit
LTHEILRANTGMVPIVHQRYVQKALVASTPIISTLLKEISDGIPHLRLIVDGLDECDVDVQVGLVKLVLDLRKASKVSFKAIISSRELPHIDRQLRPKTTVSLYQKTDRALRIYIQNGVQRLRENFRHLTKTLVDRVEAHLLKRAEGESFSDRRQNTRS